MEYLKKKNQKLPSAFLTFIIIRFRYGTVNTTEPFLVPVTFQVLLLLAAALLTDNKSKQTEYQPALTIEPSFVLCWNTRRSFFLRVPWDISREHLLK